MSGITGTQAELLYTLTTAVTKNTYTTQAAYTGVLGTNTVCSIPAGLVKAGGSVPNPVGRALHLKWFGTIATTAAATFANAIGVNPVAGATTTPTPITINTAYTPTASVTAQMTGEAWFTCTAFLTSTMTLQCNGHVVYQTIASGGAVSTASNRQDFGGTFTGLDPRVEQYVELFGTWSASAAGNTTTVQQMFLWGLN